MTSIKPLSENGAVVRRKLARNTLFFAIGCVPDKRGGLELFLRQLGTELCRRGYGLVICGEGNPSDGIKAMFEDLPVAFEVIPHQGGLALANSVQMARLLVKYRPKILVYTLGGPIRTWPQIAQALRVPRIVYVDGTSRIHSRDKLSGLKARVARFLCSPISAVIAVSQFVKTTADSEGLISPYKTRVIYNGVERGAQDLANRSEFRLRFGIPTDRIVVTQVSWLVPEKGVHTLLEAAAIVLNQHPETHFVFVGDGPLRSSLLQRAKILGITDRVTLTGVISDPSLEGVYSGSDVCCQLSEWEEAFGFVIAEAMAAGRPVIGTCVGAIPELIRDGITGFLVPRGAPEIVANRIDVLIRDPAMREQLGRSARERCFQDFEIHRMVREYMSVFGLC
jgi:glycosyltransferase involved in cell wall biosynthesis